MSLRAVGAERERLLQEDRQREEGAQAREQQRREEAAALAEVQQRYREQAKPINIGGWMVRAGG